jgi:hypothetical protein
MKWRMDSIFAMVFPARRIQGHFMPLPDGFSRIRNLWKTLQFLVGIRFPHSQDETV